MRKLRTMQQRLSAFTQLSTRTTLAGAARSFPKGAHGVLTAMSTLVTTAQSALITRVIISQLTVFTLSLLQEK
ncbi:hypothetical protein [Acinetobacter sp.]|uniref:hypothetical protein n=1 Tax=Acinetobacter sp. TaxID=472 RepID=UPI00388F9A9F